MLLSSKIGEVSVLLAKLCKMDVEIKQYYVGQAGHIID
jgi:hypothetical protein